MRIGSSPDPRRPLGRPRPAAGAWAVLVGFLAGTPAAAGITGVCPDGSIFVVQSPGDVPCQQAKRVEPHEVPPLRPEYLPRPYTWEVYQEGANPNNPYNLIDAARKVRALGAEGVESQPGMQAASPGEQPALASSRAAGPVDLGLSDAELRDLFQIVELSQRAVPARFVQETAAGSEVLQVALAWSSAFEARVREARRGRAGPEPGPVLLFAAAARQAERFGGHFTFVQGHLAFQPEAEDADQLAVVQGHFGALEAGEVVLGYVLLPAAMDLAAPMDVYWHDRRRTVTFQP